MSKNLRLISIIVGVVLLAALYFTGANATSKSAEDAGVRLMNEIEMRERFRLVEWEVEKQEEVEKDYKVLNVVATSYAPFDNQSGICADDNPNSTSIGLRPGRNIIAVDPKEILYNTEIYIPKLDLHAIAGDTGAALRNDKQNIRIDIFSDTYKEAMRFGKQELEIWIYE